MSSVSNLLTVPIKLSSHPDSPSFYDTLYPILDKLPIDLKPSPTELTYELRELDRLRLKFITGIHSKSSEGRIHINVLTDCLEYYKQLSCSIPKLPIFEIDFSWGNAFLPNEAKVAIPNLYYEKMNILFNMAIIYCQLGCFQNRTNDQGLKLAGHYFQLSAGIFDQLRNTIENRPNLTSNIPDPIDLPLDFSHYCLDFLINLNLAQAQECFWQKAVLDQLKNATIAKLSKQVSDYYDRAFTSASHRSVSVLFNESMVNHLQLKKLHFEAASEYRMSCDCLATNQYGMEIARLKIAQDLVRAANKLGGPFASPAALDDLQSLQQVIDHNLSRAEKDNSIIYLDVTPKQVPKINMAPMVKPHIPKEVENPKEVLNKEEKPILLKTLPPYSLFQAISIYEERRDQLVNRELIQKLNAIDKIYQTTINGGDGGDKGTDLPSAVTNAQLPNEVLMMMDEVMDLGGMQELKDKVKAIIDLASQNSNILNQNFGTLNNIQKLLDERYDEFLGAWDYDSPEELSVKHEKISQAFAASQESDQKLIQKVNDSDRIFTLLNSPSNDVKTFVFTTSPTTSSHPKINLSDQDLYHFQNEFHKRQQMKMEMEQIRQGDDIQPILKERFQSLIDNHPNMDPDLIELAQFEPLFQNQLRKYDTFLNLVSDEESQMKQFLSQNNIETPQGSPISKSLGNSEIKIEELKVGFEDFKWCLTHLSQGENFHNQLNSILTSHQSKIQEFFNNMEADFKEFCQQNPTLLGDEDLDDDDDDDRHPQSYQQQQVEEPISKSPQQPQNKFIKDESFSYGNHTDFGMDCDMTPQNPLEVPYIKNISTDRGDGLPSSPLNTPYTKNNKQ